MARALLFSLLTISLLPLVISHAHEQIPIPDNADWATVHMISEHHISTFDTASFFSLHDYSSRGAWDRDDILKTYGLKDPATSSHISEAQKQRVIESIHTLYDMNKDGLVSRDEFIKATEKGIKLPDFGLGPGHHGDMEYEYEIHHFEKFHDENTKEEDLVHPEDIEHFRLHEELEAAEEELERIEREAGVVENNIPAKFRRQGS